MACFRKTEQIANGNEFGYFENGSTRILDGESFIRAMARISEEARELHSQLDGKESIKDVFMLKQEILNEQEILRKLFFRALTFCEKEDGALPYYISDVLNIETLKDVLELLTIGNWSDPVEFNVFQNNMKSLKKSYDEKFEAVQDYEASLREQIENGS